MPIQEGVLIAMKDGVVEMTATIADPQKDEPNDFAAAASTRIFEHQYQAMTDVAILNPSNLAIATCLISRDPLPPALKSALVSLAFEAIDTEASGIEERSIFSRLQKPRRSKLDKWRTLYLRAADVSLRLGAFEEQLVDQMPHGPLPQIAERGSEALIEAARTHLRLALPTSHEGVGQLERQILQERAQKNGRLVLHPAAASAMAAFVGASIIRAAPSSSWSDDPDDDAPLMVVAPKGGVVRTDPEYRVVNFVAKGNKEMLTTYLETVVRQSLTAARQT
jgi:hypothetical protein